MELKLPRWLKNRLHLPASHVDGYLQSYLGRKQEFDIETESLGVKIVRNVSLFIQDNITYKDTLDSRYRTICLTYGLDPDRRPRYTVEEINEASERRYIESVAIALGLFDPSDPQAVLPSMATVVAEQDYRRLKCYCELYNLALPIDKSKEAREAKWHEIWALPKEQKEEAQKNEQLEG